MLLIGTGKTGKLIEFKCKNVLNKIWTNFPSISSKARGLATSGWWVSVRELFGGVVKELTSQPHTSTSSCGRKQTAEVGGDVLRCLSLTSLMKHKSLLCYRGILYSLAKIPGCVVKVMPERLSRAKGIHLQGFSVLASFTMTCLHQNRICVSLLMERSYPCLCLISQQNVCMCMCLGYPVRIWKTCWARSATRCPTWGSSEKNFR